MSQINPSRLTRYSKVVIAAAIALCALVPSAQAEPPRGKWKLGDDLGGSGKDVSPPGLALPDGHPDLENRPTPEGHGAGNGQAGSSRAHSGTKGKAAPSTTVEQRRKLLTDLYAQLAAAADPESAAPIVGAIEQLWAYSGSPTADLLAARALQMAQTNRSDIAMRMLGVVVELQPDYAEAWNRRAYLHYLDGETELALADLKRVLALEPNHFKALEGLAAILENAGESKSALKAYDSLLKVYPAMPGAKASRDGLAQKLEGQGI